MLRMSYNDHFLSVVRPCIRPLTFSNDFQTTSPLKPLRQFCSNFIWSLLRLGEWKFAKMVVVRWPRWQPCTYMMKTFNNFLLDHQVFHGDEGLIVVTRPERYDIDVLLPNSYFKETIFFWLLWSIITGNYLFKKLLGNYLTQGSPKYEPAW